MTRPFLGLIGGMSWTSTAEYYRRLNEVYQRRRGGLHSAPLLLWSFDFAPIEALQCAGDWPALSHEMCKAGCALARAGAGALLICTNTMHRVAESLSAAVELPVIHIADVTGDAIKQREYRSIGLLGTRFTMREAFYRERLAQRFGLQVLSPHEPDLTRVDQIIYTELCENRILDNSRDELHAIIGRLAARGAEAVVLGCTELPLLARTSQAPVPLFDTTELHVQAGVEWLLASAP